jgi:hypothetical protein
VKPNLTKNILTFDPACGPGQIATFSVPKLTDKEKGKLALPSDSDLDLITLDKVCVVDADTTAPILFLKVVFLSTEKKSTYSFYRTAKVRDVANQKHFIQLFGKYRDEVETGKVYKFSSLLVQKFKLENELWGRVRTQPNTRIVLASEGVSARFAHISIADTTMKGMLFAHEKIYIYHSCIKCYKRVDPMIELCGHCGTKLAGDSSLKSFNVTLLVANPDLDDVVRVLVFASHLNMDRGDWDEDAVQSRLESLHMQHVTIGYDKDNMRGLSVKAETIDFDMDSEDSGCLA